MVVLVSGNYTVIYFEGRKKVAVPRKFTLALLFVPVYISPSYRAVNRELVRCNPNDTAIALMQSFDRLEEDTACIVLVK